MSGRLTIDGADGIRAFCSSCPDKPTFGKCDIGNECYYRQVFKALREYEAIGTVKEFEQLKTCSKCQVMSTQRKLSCHECKHNPEEALSNA